MDGNEVEIQPMGSPGLIAFSVGAGKHEIKVVFGPTVLRRVAAWISTATAMSLLVLAAWLALRQRFASSG